MLSLKYKNLIKKSLFEENDIKFDNKENINTISKFLVDVDISAKTSKQFYEMNYLGGFVSLTSSNLTLIIPRRFSCIKFKDNDEIKKYNYILNQHSSKSFINKNDYHTDDNLTIPSEKYGYINILSYDLLELLFNKNLGTFYYTEPERKAYYWLKGINTNVKNEEQFIKESSFYKKLSSDYIHMDIKDVSNKIDDMITNLLKTKKDTSVKTTKDLITKTTNNINSSDKDASIILERYKHYSLLSDMEATEEITDDVEPNNTSLYGVNGTNKNISLNIACLIGTGEILRSKDNVVNKCNASINNFLSDIYSKTNKKEITVTYSLEVLKKTIETTDDGKPCTPIKIVKEGLETDDDKNKNKNIIYIPQSHYTNVNWPAISSNLGVWPAEILSPLALMSLSDDINWGHDESLKTLGTINSKRILEIIFGKENIQNALIKFPESGNMLYDSILYIPSKNGKYKQIQISTKGGQNGLGASASIVGLRDSLLVKDAPMINEISTMDDVKQYLKQYSTTQINIPLFEKHPIIMLIMIILCSIGSDRKKQLFILDKLSEFKKIYDIPTPWSKNSFTGAYGIIHSLSKTPELSEVIMTLLNAQKYDFAQFNLKPHISDGFNYSYNVQYPAIFKGNIELSIPSSGCVKFHIIGEKS